MWILMQSSLLITQMVRKLFKCNKGSSILGSQKLWQEQINWRKGGEKRERLPLDPTILKSVHQFEFIPRWTAYQ